MTNFDESAVRSALKKLIPTVDWAAVSSDASLDAAGVDSLDKANLFLELEEASGVQISDDEYQNLDSVNAIVEIVNAKLSTKIM